MMLGAFQEDFEGRMEDQSLTEFIVQFFYASFGKLGIPGSRTQQVVIDNISVVAPDEVPFHGAYRLLEAFPFGKLILRSAEYTEDSYRFVEEKLKAGKFQALEKVFYSIFFRLGRR